MTLREFVKIRNGVSLGSSGALSIMLVRSFGAGSFGEFWQYWNPVWGYYLGKYIYIPLKKIIPYTLSYLATFLCSGLIHDIAIMIFSRQIRLLFTPLFFLYGLEVLVARKFKVKYSHIKRNIRFVINLAYLVLNFLLVKYLLI